MNQNNYVGQETDAFDWIKRFRVLLIELLFAYLILELTL